MPRLVGKLGKQAPRANPRTLSLAKYVGASTVLPPPIKVYWEYLLKFWPMFLNDKLGCCVFAAGGHLIENWTAHTGVEADINNSQILAGYEAVGGYVPDNPSTDNGAAITDFLTYWASTGFAGTKISGWASIALNQTSLMQAIRIFGAVDIGFQVPQSAMDQFTAGDNWDVVDNDGGIDGGHSVPILGAGSQGCACITWGKIQYMSWAFFAKYCDEAYAIITDDWLKSGTTPSGFDLATLQADLVALES